MGDLRGRAVTDLLSRKRNKKLCLCRQQGNKVNILGMEQEGKESWLELKLCQWNLFRSQKRPWGREVRTVTVELSLANWYPAIRQSPTRSSHHCRVTVSWQPDLGQIISLPVDFNLTTDSHRSLFLMSRAHTIQYAFIWHGKERKRSSKNGREEDTEQLVPFHPIKSLVRLD